MSAKLDLISAAEPHKMSGASSAAPNSGQKLSLLAAKSGFVIPKNKLSGSLVPVFRGAQKHGVTGAINEESSKQVVRKTKWGPDLTQDAAVKRGKALALQVFSESFQIMLHCHFYQCIYIYIYIYSVFHLCKTNISPPPP